MPCGSVHDIRLIKEEDTEAFHHMMCKLDEETPFMMYDPGKHQGDRVLPAARRLVNVKRNGRLGVTVECPNVGTRALYEKVGFKVEGMRPKSMNEDGSMP